MSFPPGTEMFQFSGFASPKPILFSLVIPLPFNSPTDCSVTKLNSEDGFPHSEIVGSKLAHSSPTLIAACHVLHRLYMPRHPRIALTSRLRVHTTNDITGCPFGSPTRQSSASWSLSGADDYNLSQIMYYDDVDIWSLEPLVQIALRRSASRTA